MKGLGKRIRQVRGDMNQADFGRIFGLTQAAISKIELDLMEPNAEFFARLISHFGLNLNSLFGGQPTASGTVIREEGAKYTIGTDQFKKDAEYLARVLRIDPLLAAAILALRQKPPT